jgi:GNAT superfamily N-acetyltransferase
MFKSTKTIIYIILKEVSMEIRRYKDEDAEEISALVCRNFIEINSKDYPIYEMQSLAKEYDAEKIRNIASHGHMYVVCKEKMIIGTGSISSFWGSETESILLTIFVLPEYHGQGVGQKIIKTLEQDELFLRAKRIEIPASITACGFYEKMGYAYVNGNKLIDGEGHYRMEKYR